MSTWFEVRHYGQIRTVEVSSFTEHTVVVTKNGFYGIGRKNRIAEYTCYFPSFDEAKHRAIIWAESEVSVARNRLERANGDLNRLKGLRNPLEEKA